uniref:glycerophosphodiester phosphodiesterase n=1 Tax=Quercus lobata TaxID=97700 RepID=A0A7N2MS89_QUELO
MADIERAIEEGADFIETDILSSKDGVLICFHDVTLDDTTDILQHKEFANCKRTYEVQGNYTTGFFTVMEVIQLLTSFCHIDFTIKELKSLRVKQRYPFRDQQYDGKFTVITFEEYILIALDAPRVVGIYPEIKNPVFINEHVKWPGGKRFEDKFVETLKKYGYKGSYLSKEWLAQPAFIQSFAPTSLIYVSNQTDLPKIFLIDEVTIPTQDTNQSYWEITSDSYFQYIKQYVEGIGPWKDTVVPVKDNYVLTPTDLVARAHAHNLQVHPYTFRNENKFLHFNFHQDPYQEYAYWIHEIGVDGIFTDFTGSLNNYQEWTSQSSDDSDSSASKLLHKIALLVNSYERGTFRHLLTYKEHAVEMVKPIIKDTDLDPYVKQTTEELGASGLFDLSRGALRTLNKEMTALNEKLKEETRLQEKAQEEKTNLEAVLTAIYRQVETVRADAITKFKASQPFIDAYVVYYGDEFEDCLKQVRSIYPNLDLSKVTMDDSLLRTPTRDDTVNEDIEDSTKSEWEPKDDNVVLAQLAVEWPVVPLAPSANDPPAHDTPNFATQDAPNSSAQDAQNPTA